MLKFNIYVLVVIMLNESLMNCSLMGNDIVNFLNAKKGKSCQNAIVVIVLDVMKFPLLTWN